MVPGTTRCEHFDTETKLCKIYDARPMICRMNEWRNPPDEVMAKACAFMRNAQYPETATDPE